MGERKKEEKRKKDSTQTEKENNLLSHFGIGSILSLVRENLLTHSPPIFFEKKEKVENERENLLRIHQLRWALLFFPIVQQLNIICAQLIVSWKYFEFFPIPSSPPGNIDHVPSTDVGLSIYTARGE